MLRYGDAFKPTPPVRTATNASSGARPSPDVVPVVYAFEFPRELIDSFRSLMQNPALPVIDAFMREHRDLALTAAGGPFATYPKDVPLPDNPVAYLFKPSTSRDAAEWVAVRYMGGSKLTVQATEGLASALVIHRGMPGRTGASAVLCSTRPGHKSGFSQSGDPDVLAGAEFLSPTEARREFSQCAYGRCNCG